jgi:hypothetical protein
LIFAVGFNPRKVNQVLRGFVMREKEFPSGNTVAEGYSSAGLCLDGSPGRNPGNHRVSSIFHGVPGFGGKWSIVKLGLVGFGSIMNKMPAHFPSSAAGQEGVKRAAASGPLNLAHSLGLFVGNRVN